MKSNKLFNQYKRISFKAFMINTSEQPSNKDLQKLNNYNNKMQQIEKQLNEQGVFIH